MSAIIDPQYVGNLPVYGPDAAGFIEHWCDTVKTAAFLAGYKPVRTPVIFRAEEGDKLTFVDDAHRFALQADRHRAHDYIAAKTVTSYRDLPLRIYELVPSYRLTRGLEMDWRFEFRCYYEDGVDNEAERLLVLDIWNKVKPLEFARPECYVTADAITVDVDYTDKANGSRQAKCVTMLWPDLMDVFEMSKVYLV